MKLKLSLILPQSLSGDRAQVKRSPYQMSRNLAAILGGAAVAMALVGMVIVLIWFCLSHNRSVSRTSETGSSDLSQVGRIELPLQDTRRFEMEELSLATKNFTDQNLIGEGQFGEVYKGLLQDGVLVAVKKRRGLPSQEFVDEVRYLSSIHHRNLVTLLGYCQENNLQFLYMNMCPMGVSPVTCMALVNSHMRS